ncbi:MAG TPA: multiheme c-type cytochrome, partial [Anaeromyxobacteraceae bacterium]|nr:multiheme c-type cytochrome [Anaeromyxobacteraceae bacterium]
MHNPGVAGAVAAASLRPTVVLAVLWLVAWPAGGAERVGSETCRACHQAAYQIWKASPHARASENLTPAQRADLRCAFCHAPDRARAALEEGPFQRGDQGAAPGFGDLASVVEGGVGCEACHGAGQYYTPSYVMRDSELARAVGLVDPGEKSCRVCHSGESPSLTPFDFAAKVKLIDHW